MALLEITNVCPSCGGYENPISNVSGFCIPCTKRLWPNKAVCDNCGRIEERGQFRTTCQYCQEEEWLKNNADKIEGYMAAGLTVAMAVVKVQFDNRPICLSCGYKIKGGTRGRHFFCRTSSLCKSAAIKFKHLKERKNLPKDEALSETLKWLDSKRRENGAFGATVE
jgi:hypothetical protein